MSVDRRQILAGAGAGLVAISLPSWFAACRTTEVAPSPPAYAGVPAGDGRALLILHVEDDEGRSAELGRLVGTFLMHATDEQVALLAGCDLVCASTRELAERGPECAQRKDVRAVVVLSREQPVCAVSGNLYPTPLSIESSDSDRAQENWIRARHVWLAEQLASVLEPDRATIERRAAEELASHDLAPVDGLSPADFAREWPRTTRLRAEQELERRAEWFAALADEVRARLCMDSPPGSTWATWTGCAATYDKPLHDVRVAIGCGMGHSPKIGRRFLHFYTQEEREG